MARKALCLSSCAFKMLQKSNYQQILKNKYRPGTWAVVTGGSSGIGRAFANEFASLGFNIVIISHLEKENKETEQELQQRYGVQTMSIYADFSKCQEPGYFEKIGEQLQSLEISILVNNAGVPQPGGFNFDPTYISLKNNTFQDLKTTDTLSVLTINCVAQVLMTQVLLKNMGQRRSMIINLASIVSDVLIPGLGIYIASKFFMKGFSRALGGECRMYKEKIDVFCLKPGGVSTNMLKEPAGKHISTPQQTVQACLRDFAVGIRESNGYWKHKMQKHFLIKRVGLISMDKQ